jgi:CII-binding regulator of phage lambda lysogenization HflD
MPVFGTTKPQRKTLRVVINDLVDRTNDNTKRLRLLEQRGEILDARDNSTEQTMLQQFKELQEQLKVIEVKVAEKSEMMGVLESRLNEVIKQVKKAAVRADVEGLKEMVELYNPIRSKFVTRSEVEQMLSKR